MTLNPISKNGLLLSLFALLCTAIVTLTYVLTRPSIMAAELANKYAVLNQVIPDSSHDNALVSACVEIRDEHLLGSNQPHHAYIAMQAGQPAGVAIEVTAPNGYSGRIELIVGIDVKGTISGVRVLSHAETPGLGDKVESKKSNWLESFIGKTADRANDPAWAVKKDGGQFDQFTGATITPRAVVAAVHRALLFYQAHQQELYQQRYDCGASHD